MNPEASPNPSPSEDITTKSPEEVLKPEFLADYKELHEDIWDRLSRIDTNIIILEKILGYPLRHIYAPPNTVFWMMVCWNFFEMSIILLWNLLCDQGRDTHTLVKFKNTISKHILTEPLKAAYREHLRNAKFSKELERVREKTGKMRHEIVHRLRNAQGRLKAEYTEGVSLSELRNLFEGVKRLFDVCSFGVGYDASFYPGGTIGGKPIKMDIEELLDLIVKNSSWLNGPETNPFWNQTKEHTPKVELDELNRWRKKFGLAEV